MDFLNIGASTYNLGLSEAGVAAPQGPSSMFINPANTVRLESSVLQADFNDWILDSRNTHASAVIKDDNQAFGAGFYSSSIRDIQARNQPGPSQGEFPIEYLTIGGSYAYQYGNMSAGITAQYLNESYLNSTASGYALNGGITGSLFDNRVDIGASVLNIGRMQKLNQVRSDLPANLRAGVKIDAVEFNTPGENDFPILVITYGDYVQPLKDNLEDNGGINTSGYQGDPNEPFANLGLEVMGGDLFSFRFGYKTGDTERPWSMGAGIHIEPVVVDYALLPFKSGYGTSHSIGVRYAFSW